MEQNYVKISKKTLKAGAGISGAIALLALAVIGATRPKRPNAGIYSEQAESYQYVMDLNERIRRGKKRRR